MNLLKTINELNLQNIDLISKIYDAISARLDWLESREPDSEGDIYEEWEEKYETFTEILDYADRLTVYDSMDDEDILFWINQLKESINDFQATYGGLSRLKI